MMEADARLEAARGSLAVVTKTVGVSVAAALLLGIVGGGWGLTRRLLERHTVEVRSYAVLPPSVAPSAGPMNGLPAASALVVLLLSVNSGGLVASDVVVSEAPRAAFGAPRSATIPVIYSGQTVAVILTGAGLQGRYPVRVTVGRWRAPDAWATVLPDVTWRRSPTGFEARVSNVSGQAAPAVRLVGVFFDPFGRLRAVGAQPVGAVPPETTRSVTVPVTYGSVPSHAQAALFEEAT